MLRRTGFARKTYTPAPRAPLSRGRLVPMERIEYRAVSVPKSCPIQHAGYIAAVRTLPCMRCAIVGFTQFCHSDEGKGMGLKTDCREGWPGCGPHGDEPGCHWYAGTSGQLGKQARRDLEAHYARRTRIRILGMGLWPANLPLWPEDS